MQRNPLFITFEGGEGAGKTTQIKLFYQWFIKKYGPAITTREPGGVPVSEQIREVLLDRKNIINPLTEVFLFEAARTQFTGEIIIPTLVSRKSVLCDRFYDSTTALQGYAGGFDLNEITRLNNLASRGYAPDLTFIIDVDPKIGIANAKNRGEINRIDAKGIDYHQKVAEGFRQIASDNLDRCVLIPYQDGIEKVQRKMQEEFTKRYLSR